MLFWNSFAFFNNLRDIGNLISDSSAFSKSSLNIWKFMVHLLLKPGLENFEHDFTSMWDECILWPLFGIRMKTDLFQSCGHCWVFHICWHIERSTFTASSFRIWNSSTGISSLPLALFIVMLQRPTWLHIPGGEWSYNRDYLDCEELFCTVLLCTLATSFNIFCFY